MKKNKVNSGNIDSLKFGNTILVGAKETADESRIQLEFAEIVINPSSGNNILGMFNKSDSRFTEDRKPRRAWQDATKESAAALLGLPELETAEYAPVDDMGNGKPFLVLNVLNPVIVEGEAAGERLRVFVNETTTPDQWQKDNVLKAAKKSPSKGFCLSPDGEPIFSQPEVGFSSESSFIAHDRDKFATGEEVEQIVSQYEVGE